MVVLGTCGCSCGLLVTLRMANQLDCSMFGCIWLKAVSVQAFSNENVRFVVNWCLMLEPRHKVLCGNK